MGCLVVVAGMMLFSLSASPAHANVTVTISGESGCSTLEGGEPVNGQTNWNPSTNTCTVDDDLQPTIQVGNGNGGGNGETWTIEAGFNLVLTDGVSFDVQDYSTLINYGTISAGSSAAIIQIYQGSFVDNYGTMDGGVDSDGTFSNYGTLTLSNSEFSNGGGMFNNTGTVNIQSGGILNNTAHPSGNGVSGTTLNEATLDNKEGGTINIDASSQLFNQNYFVNDGTVNDDGKFINTLQFAENGVVILPGVCFCQYGPFVFGDTLNENTGVINVQSPSGELINNLGLMDNNNGAVINVDNSLTNENEGNITNNAGSITVGPGGNLDNLYNLFNQAGGTITNNGAMENSPNENTYPVLDFTIPPAEGFENAGTFDNNWQFFNYAGVMSNSGTITNTASYNNVGDDGSGFMSNSGPFNNSGQSAVLTDSPGFTLQDSATITNSGAFSNQGEIIITNINDGIGLLVNSGSVSTTGTGSITADQNSIINSCSGQITGTQPPAGSIEHVACAPVITSSGGVTLAGGLTVSGTENLASNGGSPLTIYVSIGAYLQNDYIVSTTTSSSGQWSVFVPLSPGTSSVYALACSTPLCYGSLLLDSPASNSITVTADQDLDSTTCGSVLGGTWGTATCSTSGSYTLPSGSTLNVGPGTTLNILNTGKLTNDGTITNLGTIDLEAPGGTLDNQAGGFLSDSGTINNDGQLENTGTLNVTLDSSTCTTYPLDGYWKSQPPFQTCTVPVGNSVEISSGVTLDVSAGQVLYNSGTITNSGTMDMAANSFYYNACGGSLIGNALSGSATIQYAPCAPTISTPSGTVSLTSSLSISGTADLASNGGAAMTITLYDSNGTEIGSATTDSGGAWTISGNPSPGVLTLYAVATSSANINSPPSTEITVTYQLLNQASCGSPIGGTWNSGTCTLSGSFTLPGTGALYIQSGTTLVISGSGDLYTNGFVTDMGVIASSGSITNAYILLGRSPGDGSLTVGGTLTNTGTLTNEGSLTIQSGGVFSNQGQYENEVIFFGSVQGDGRLIVQSSATLDNAVGGTITSQAGYVQSNGAVTNEGTITGTEASSFESDGTFTNTGSFTIESSFLFLSGSFTNKGIVTLAFIKDITPELHADYNGGNFYNYGTLNLQGLGTADFENTLTVNEVGGIISNAFDLRIESTLDNYGSILNTGNATTPFPGIAPFSGIVEVTGTLNNYGLFTNVNATTKLLVPSGGLVNNYGSFSNIGLVGPPSPGDAGTFASDCSSTFTGNPVEGLTLTAIVGVVCPTASINTAVYDAAANSVWAGTETAGATAYDTATLTSSSGPPPTGLVTYSLFENSACTSPAAETDAVTISAGGIVPASDPSGPLAVGAYSFQASYGGDSVYQPSDSTCEAFTILPASPTIAAAATPSAVTLGSSIATLEDTATLTGAFDPTGMITFTLSGPRGVVDTEAVTVSGDGAYQTPTGFILPTSGVVTGSYQWDASYSGDSNNVPVSDNNAVNEQVLVLPATVSVSTSVSGSGLATLGSSATDTAALSGGYYPTGTITFSVYSDPSCETFVSSSTVDLATFVTSYTSGSFTPTSTGSYYWTAAYSGDANNVAFTTPCGATGETLIVTQPEIAPNPTAAGPGSQITVSGSGFFPIDTGATLSIGGSTIVSASSCPVAVGGTFSCTMVIPATLPSGEYTITATGAPGGENASASFLVKFPTTLTTSVNDSATSEAWTGSEVTGASAYDTSSIITSAGVAPLTGTVTYTFYAASASCAGTGAVQSTVTLTSSGGSVPESAATEALGAGSYSYSASYSGDSNYIGSTSACESFTVAKASPTVASAVDDVATSNAWGGSETTGSSAYDTSSVSGVPGFAPGGTLTYEFFINGNDDDAAACTGSPSTAQTVVMLTAGAVPNSVDTGPLAAGSYAYEAIYSGDSNYASSAGQCEAFSVSRGPTTTSSAVYDASSSVPWSGSEVTGASAFDTATVVGGAPGVIPTGSVTYTFFADGGCSGMGGSTITVLLLTGGGSVPQSSATSPLAAGSYSFTVQYSGDSNYLGSSGTCESFAVQKAPTSVSTVVDDASTSSAWAGTEVAGSSAFDSAAVSGVTGFPPSGSMVYSFYANGACSGTPASQMVTLTDGVAPPSATSPGLLAGSYSYSASYGGDSNYQSSSGSCESFTVAKAPTTPIVACTPNPATVGVSTTCLVTVTGYLPSGTVTFSSSSSGDSAGAFTPTSGQCTLSAGTCSVTYLDPSAGTWQIEASYSGDANNLAGTGSTSLTEAYKACSQVTGKGGQNLKGADLESCNLAGFDLSGDNLMGANLAYANLQGASLKGANLMGANLTASSAPGANFEGANLMGDSLKSGDFAGANFQGANMKGDDLSYGVFTGAEFKGANLMDSNMDYGNFDSANFTGANTKGVTTTGATFVGAIDAP